VGELPIKQNNSVHREKKQAYPSREETDCGLCVPRQTQDLSFSHALQSGSTSALRSQANGGIKVGRELELPIIGGFLISDQKCRILVLEQVLCLFAACSMGGKQSVQSIPTYDPTPREQKVLAERKLNFAYYWTSLLFYPLPR
jgi:hypothetical protein